MAPVVPTERDLRLDLFRGLALWLIFLDHVPNNIVSWFTIRNYGFSDATEIFIFISGYTAAFVYGRAMLERGFIVAGARILKRAWQIYVAHIFLFAIYIAEIAYVASSFENPLYAEEMNALDFLKQPEVTIIQALLLKFKPVNMDVLPLYIVLLLLFPAILWLLMRNAALALAASVALYALTWEFGWNMPSYPSGHWFFNPFAWQLLFVFGAWCALGGATRLAPALRSPITLWIAIAYLLFAFGITLTWHFPRLGYLVPRWLGEWMYPIDKINLDVLRFAHFLALAALTVRFIPRDWPALEVALAVAGDPVRPAFAGDLLPRRVPGLCRAFRDGRDLRRRADAGAAERGRHPHHDWHGGADLVVQAGRKPRVGIAQAAAGCRPCRRRGMRTWIAIGVRSPWRDRAGRSRIVQCGSARAIGRCLRGAGLSAVRRQPACSASTPRSPRTRRSRSSCSAARRRRCRVRTGRNTPIRRGSKPRSSAACRASR